MTLSLLDLPNELLLYIARFLPDQEDISDFSRANRHLHAVLDGYLYRYNVLYDNAYALTFGAYKGRRSVVEKCLAARPADVDAPPFPEQTRSWTSHNALCNAIKCQHTELVELLLDHGASPHHGCLQRGTPLIMTAHYGNVETMRLLIERGADVNGKGDLKHTPLHCAAVRGDVEFIRLLLEHGAEVDSTGDNGQRPLHLAAGLGHFAATQALLDHGASVAATDADGRTPFIFAPRSGDVPCVELLLRHGAENQLSTEMGRTALFDALRFGQTEVAQLLLDRGVVLERMEELMHETAQLGHLSCLNIVLRHDCEVDCKTQNQETPLLLAVRNGRTETVQRLVGAGADIHSADIKGETPLSVARARVDNRLELMLLGKWGCRCP